MRKRDREWTRIDANTVRTAETKFGGARLPESLTILTKVLTLVNSKATLGRCPCRAVGLSCRLFSTFGTRNGGTDRPNDAFNLVHTIDRGSASVLV
jgi:hypothetical protein